MYSSCPFGHGGLADLHLLKGELKVFLFGMGERKLTDYFPLRRD